MKLLSKYGVVLRPMEESDLDQVRKWRDAPHVRENFEFQAEITPERHQQWWSTLDPATNFYWVIEVKGEGIGVIHAKEIDWEAKTTEAGIFIGNKAYLNTPFPIAAIYCMMDYLFEEEQMTKIFAKVNSNSQANLNLNQSLGYEIFKQGRFVLMKIEKGNYFSQRNQKNKKILQKPEGM